MSVIVIVVVIEDNPFKTFLGEDPEQMNPRPKDFDIMKYFLEPPGSLKKSMEDFYGRENFPHSGSLKKSLEYFDIMEDFLEPPGNIKNPFKRYVELTAFMENHFHQMKELPGNTSSREYLLKLHEGLNQSLEKLNLALPKDSEEFAEKSLVDCAMDFYNTKQGEDIFKTIQKSDILLRKIIGCNSKEDLENLKGTVLEFYPGVQKVLIPIIERSINEIETLETIAEDPKTIPPDIEDEKKSKK